jgi:hypothetical protein
VFIVFLFVAQEGLWKVPRGGGALLRKSYGGEKSLGDFSVRFFGAAEPVCSGSKRQNTSLELDDFSGEIAVFQMTFPDAARKYSMGFK